jgi:hypothetical protein
LKSLDPDKFGLYHPPVVSGRLGSAHIEIGTGQNQLIVEGGKKEKQEVDNGRPTDSGGNEPAPLLLIGVALLPLLGVLGWFLGLFG